SLRGLVLPIGGVKEKVLAAARAGITTVLLPARNQKDLEDVPEAARAQGRFVWLEGGGRAGAPGVDPPGGRGEGGAPPGGGARGPRRQHHCAAAGAQPKGPRGRAGGGPGAGAFRVARARRRCGRRGVESTGRARGGGSARRRRNTGPARGALGVAQGAAHACV